MAECDAHGGWRAARHALLLWRCVGGYEVLACVLSNYLVWQIRRALQRFDAAHPPREAEWVQWQAARRERGLSAALHWAALYIDDTAAASADDLLFGADGEDARGGVPNANKPPSTSLKKRASAEEIPAGEANSFLPA